MGTDSPKGEVNETVRHEWMTCRARADRWKEESSLLQEEMRRVIAFLEWKSSSWDGRVGSRSGTVMADIQHGIDGYARKQAHTYHELAVSLVNQWLPHLSALGLDISWAKTYPWAAEIISPLVKQPLGPPNTDKNPLPNNPPPGKATPPSAKRDGLVGPPNTHENPLPDNPPPGKVTPSSAKRDGVVGPSNTRELNPLPDNPPPGKATLPSAKRDSMVKQAVLDDSSGDESDGRDSEADEGDICDDGENSDKFGVGFEYDDQYMS